MKAGDILKAYGRVMGLFALLLLAVLLVIGGLSLVCGPAFADAFRKGTLPHGQTVLYVSILYVLVLCLITWYWKRFSGRDVAETGLRFSKNSAGGFMKGSLLASGLFAAYFIPLAALGFTAPFEMKPLTAAFFARLVIDGAAVYAIAVTEEYMFRGVVMRLFLRTVPPLHAIVATNVLFALCHMFGHLPAVVKGAFFITLLLLGCLLSVAALRTGELWYATGFHGTLIFLSMLKDSLGVLKLVHSDYDVFYGMGGHNMAGIWPIVLFAGALCAVMTMKAREDNADGA